MGPFKKKFGLHFRLAPQRSFLGTLACPVQLQPSARAALQPVSAFKGLLFCSLANGRSRLRRLR